jgi:hypothetical protein
VAADVFDYVDDERGTGPTAEDAWRVGSKVGKTCSYYGNQDATRKRRAQSQTPGAWAGVLVGTTEQVYVSVTDEKWAKTKQEIRRLRVAYDVATAPGGNHLLDRKLLEQVAGFLVHVTGAYPRLKVYLNGIYATMNSWRPDRDEEGWKVGDWKVDYDSADAPQNVRVLSRLGHDIHALEELTAAEVPPKLPARPSRTARPRYLFGDASGRGFGMSDWQPGSRDVLVDYGLWSEDISDRSSSNQREFLNTVRKVEALDADDEIDEGTEFWFFTDNFFSESCFYKGGGGAKSQATLDLVLRLHMIEMKGKAFVHIVWVSGRRMIVQGTDGLSRGEFLTGIMRGMPMLEFVPLHLSVLERRKGPVLDFLSNVTQGEPFLRLQPDQWLLDPHDVDGNYLWTPPPVIADVAVFQLAEAVHIRPWNTHIVVLPGLMTALWRKMLSKTADVILTLPFDDTVWPRESQFEKLTFAIVFPLLDSNPWRVKRTPLLRQFEVQVRNLQGQSFTQYRDSLCKLWLSARALPALPSGMACSMLSHTE